MRFFHVLISLFLVSLPVFSQTDLDKLADTERAFARTALEKNTKVAFLEFMTNDALAFVPVRTRAKDYWSARAENASALVWAPNFGDIARNGILGYTTGNWEFRPKGKSDAPVAFGNFVTIWLRQPSGQYRWVLDIGINHDKPEKYSEEFTPISTSSAGNPRRLSAADAANRFYEMANSVGVQKAYAQFADNNIRFYREGEFPGVGRSTILARVKKNKGAFAFPKRSVFFESDDLAYVNNTYTFTSEKGEVETGNFLHIWKFADGQWRLVLDVFKPVPQKAN
jgi:ketosteroid isomerase-like protein